MKNTNNTSEKKTGRLILGKTYFCNWAWRSARYIGTRKDGKAYFKDVRNCVISREAETVMQDIDWEK